MIIRFAVAILCAATLASCGADGEPIRPTANLGLNVSNSGVKAGASIGVSQGPVNINVSVF